jgi:hypothetical protein
MTLLHLPAIEQFLGIYNKRAEQRIQKPLTPQATAQRLLTSPRAARYLRVRESVE